MKERNTTSWQPTTLRNEDIEKFTSENTDVAVIDETAQNLEELFLLRNPRFKFDKNYKKELEVFNEAYRTKAFGNWFYFPWNNVLVRYFPEDIHNELRTGRNEYLITSEEQNQFYYSTIVFLGMSVGSHIALTVTMTGGSRHIKLADPDILSGDNLNRIRLGFQHVGVSKAILVARQIYEINPYATIELYTDGINEINFGELLKGVDLLVEETDNPYWKLRARELARERGIPVIMGTDNGDGAIVDIERFDVNKRLAILNGLIGKLTAGELRTMKPSSLPKIAGKIAGTNLVVPRMLQSVSEVGKSLYSWPQLGTAATMCGSLGAYLARRIILKDKRIKSGRYSINPDVTFESGYKWRYFSRKKTFLKFILEMSKRK